MSTPTPDRPVERRGHCAQALAELEAYLDGELGDGDLERIREHLARCYPCTDRLSFEEQLRGMVRDGCADKAPPSLIARIEDALAESGNA